MKLSGDTYMRSKRTIISPTRNITQGGENLQALQDEVQHTPELVSRLIHQLA
jgi:hypothetical protein